jgi:hypothetical protein
MHLMSPTWAHAPALILLLSGPSLSAADAVRTAAWSSTTQATTAAQEPATRSEVVRLDGVYESERKQTAEGSVYWYYLMFYQDGSVIGMATPGVPEEAAKMLPRHDYRGVVRVSGSGVSFSLSSGSPKTTTDYDGTLLDAGERMSLRVYTRFDNKRRTEEYHFVPLARASTISPRAEAAAGASTPKTTQAKLAAINGEALQAAIAKARASMTGDQAWAIIEGHLKKFCGPQSPVAVKAGGPLPQNQQPPLGHQRTCTAIGPAGFSYSETATLMYSSDLVAALPSGATVFAQSDRNAMVLPNETSVVLGYDKSYLSQSGPIRLGIWQGKGRKVEKDTRTVTWGPRNVDVDLAGPATIVLKPRSDGNFFCDILGKIGKNTTDSEELLVHVFLYRDEPATFLAALSLVWPNAKIPTVQ